MTTLELGTQKPCPFCGGPAQLKKKSESWGYSNAAVAYGCDRCGFHLPFIEHSTMPQDNAPLLAGALLQALTSWNMRDGKAHKVAVVEKADD